MTRFDLVAFATHAVWVLVASVCLDTSATWLGVGLNKIALVLGGAGLGVVLANVYMVRPLMARFSAEADEWKRLTVEVIRQRDEAAKLVVELSLRGPGRFPPEEAARA